MKNRRTVKRRVRRKKSRVVKRLVKKRLTSKGRRRKSVTKKRQRGGFRNLSTKKKRDIYNVFAAFGKKFSSQNRRRFRKLHANTKHVGNIATLPTPIRLISSLLSKI